MRTIANEPSQLWSRRAGSWAILAVLVGTLLADRSLAQGWAPPAGEVLDAGLRVRVLGRGTPAVLLLHGLAGSNQYFGAAFDALADEGRLIVPDLLGFGDSPRPSDSDYGPDAHAAALIAALERLGVQPPIYVGAHSAGSLVAFRMAALRPDWVRGIVAFGPPLYRSEAEARSRIGRSGGMVRWLAMDTFWAGLACKAMYPFSELAARLASGIRPDLPERIARDAVKHSWASYSGTVRHLILAPQPAPALSTLRLPVRLVTGEEDEVVDLEFLRELSEGSAFVHLQVWAGGHDLPLTSAAESVEIVRRLIQGGD